MSHWIYNPETQQMERAGDAETPSPFLGHTVSTVIEVYNPDTGLIEKKDVSRAG